MRIEIGANEAGQRLDKFLRKLLKDVPLSAIFKALRKGDIRVNGKKQKEKYTLEINDVVEVRYIQSKKMTEREDNFIKVDARSLKIVYEDENMVVVEKWPGVLVHPDTNKKIPTLTDYVLSYLNEKGDYLPEKEVTFTPAPCNRLDRNTAGLIIGAKNAKALRSLNKAISQGKINKYYLTIVEGEIHKDFEIDTRISKNENKNMVKEKEDGKRIITKFHPLETKNNFTLLECKLITGKTHQIRYSLNKNSTPIIGDRKYSKSSIDYKKINLNNQALLAYKLEFDFIEDLSYLDKKIFISRQVGKINDLKEEVFYGNLIK